MKLDKERLLSFVTDIDTKKIIAKNLSRLESVINTKVPRYTDFLDPYQADVFTAVLNSFTDINYSICGGESAERRVILIYPYFYKKEELTDPMSFLRADRAGRADGISHRDVMGSLLSLGIKREKTGDIYVNEKFSDIAVDSSISDFIILSLKSIKTLKVDLHRIDETEVIYKEPEYIVKNVFVSTLRIDALIAKAYNISRNDAKELVNGGLVKLDHKPVMSISQNFSENALVSVKGRGRFKVGTDFRKTQKGNIKLDISIYK